MIDRMVRAARLKVALYEEVEADRGATVQAMLVVVLTSIAVGVGNIIDTGVAGLVGGVISGLLGWAFWAYANFLIGTKLLPEPQTEADWGQLARTMGFASTPRIFAVLALIPLDPLRGIILLGVSLWTWIAMVIAVRQALDYRSTWRALAVTLLGLIVNIGALIGVGLLLDLFI